MEPRCASLDIETYGKLKSKPEQRCFQPRRSIFIDHIPPSELTITCCLTLPTQDPRPSPSPWTFHHLSQLAPGDTLPFRLDSHTDARSLLDWIWHLDTLLGMNLQFDLAHLRFISPEFLEAVTNRLFIIDLSVLNYLECDSRPERSLKTLGPVLLTHVYDEKDLERFSTIEEVLDYNGQDTHNTLLAIQTLASRILTRLGPSPFTLQFYNDSIWSCLRMSENGVPFSLSRLISLRDQLLAQQQRVESLFSSINLPLEGEGSVLSKRAIMDWLIDQAAHQFNAIHFPEATPCPPPESLPDEHPPSEPRATDVLSATPSSSTANTSVEPSTPPPEPISSSPPSSPTPASGVPPADTSGRFHAIVKTESDSPSWELDRSLPHPLSHPLLTRTEKKREIATSSVNRSLILLYLPPTHVAHKVAELLEEHNRAQKILGSYVWPLLHHRRTKKNGALVLSSLLVPQPGDLSPCLTPLPLPMIAIPPAHPMFTNEPSEASPSSSTPSPSSSEPSSIPASDPSSSEKSSTPEPEPPFTPSARTPPPPLPIPPKAPSSSSSLSTRTPTSTSSLSSTPAPRASSDTRSPDPSSTAPSRKPFGTPPRNPDVYLSHPSWFITPSPYKDGDGSAGGTMQGRVTCKDSAHQTEPEEITG